MSLIGTTLGVYRVTSELGDGAMGAVYAAEHQTLGRRVAIKVLHERAVAKRGVVERFFNEARAANVIRHPGIVDVLDFVESETGVTYLVMEYLEGQTLASLIDREGPFDPQRAVRILRRVASALSAAHARGIIHRDLKPANLFVLAQRSELGNEQLKILDFGIAKLVEGEPSLAAGTVTGMMLGTPLYMAPEQCLDAKHVDARADIYALAVIAFEMLSKRPPFVSDNLIEVIAMHQSHEPPSLRALNPAVPTALETVIRKAMSKAPEQRHRTVDDFARELGFAVPQQPLVPRAHPDTPSSSMALAMTAAAPAAAQPVAPTSAAPRASVETELVETTPPRRPAPGRQRLILRVAAGVFAAGVLGAVGATAMRESVGPTTRSTADGRDRVAEVEDSPRHPGMVRIPAGSYPYGSDPVKDLGRYVGEEDDNTPRWVDAFAIDRYEYPNRKDTLPLVGVSLFEAIALCEGVEKRLCTEAEFEAACEGPSGLIYPYGDTFSAHTCNGPGGVEPVPGAVAPSGQSAACVSSLGVHDLSGNVAEWTSGVWELKPGFAVVRSGSYTNAARVLRCANRIPKKPETIQANIGFRCCVSG